MEIFPALAIAISQGIGAFWLRSGYPAEALNQAFSESIQINKKQMAKTRDWNKKLWHFRGCYARIALIAEKLENFMDDDILFKM
jgi:hypothetical protein